MGSSRLRIWVTNFGDAGCRKPLHFLTPGLVAQWGGIALDLQEPRVLSSFLGRGREIASKGRPGKRKHCSWHGVGLIYEGGDGGFPTKQAA